MKKCIDCEAKADKLKRGLCSICYGHRRYYARPMPPRTVPAYRSDTSCVYCEGEKPYYLKMCDPCRDKARAS